MTNITDIELADKLVEGGIGDCTTAEDDRLNRDVFWIYPDQRPMTSSTFVRDWRVAGACIEASYSLKDYKRLKFVDVIAEAIIYTNAEISRAICLAYVEAMSDE